MYVVGRKKISETKLAGEVEGTVLKFLHFALQSRGDFKMF